MPTTSVSQVILLVGLPGVGKTTLARALSRRIGGKILSRDDIRDAIFPDVYLDYSAEQNHIGTDAMLSVLRYILHHHHNARLIIDGKPFSRAHEISSIVALAEKYGARMHVIHCEAPINVIQERLQSGLSDATNIRAQRTPEKAMRIYNEFEPLHIAHLKVDMTSALKGIVEKVAAYVDIRSNADS